MRITFNVGGEGDPVAFLTAAGLIISYFFLDTRIKDDDSFGLCVSMGILLHFNPQEGVQVIPEGVNDTGARALLCLLMFFLRPYAATWG